MAEPTRSDVDAWTGTTVLELGASWCPICQAARPMIDRVLATNPAIRHVWIEDGSGRPLGRSFRVKLWPTLILMRDGVELGRVVRPRADAELHDLLAHAPAPPGPEERSGAG